MTSPIAPEDREAFDLAAAECALGLKDGAEAAELNLRRRTDAGFAMAVEGWEARLAGLASTAAPVAPSASVWTGVLSRLDQSGSVIELRLRRSLAVWRCAAAGFAALAACLALVAAWPRPTPAIQPVMTARLIGSQGPTVFVAMVDPDRHVLVVTPATVTAAPGRSPELWLIPAGGKPIPLGLAAFKRSVQLSPKVPLGGPSGVVLAMSMEPIGGSPTGQPTGPVVATGQLEPT
jgi:anti-sigma-K factor RskA